VCRSNTNETVCKYNSLHIYNNDNCVYIYLKSKEKIKTIKKILMPMYLEHGFQTYLSFLMGKAFPKSFPTSLASILRPLSTSISSFESPFKKFSSSS